MWFGRSEWAPRGRVPKIIELITEREFEVDESTIALALKPPEDLATLRNVRDVL